MVCRNCSKKTDKNRYCNGDCIDEFHIKQQRFNSLLKEELNMATEAELNCNSEMRDLFEQFATTHCLPMNNLGYTVENQFWKTIDDIRRKNKKLSEKEKEIVQDVINCSRCFDTEEDVRFYCEQICRGYNEDDVDGIFDKVMTILKSRQLL